MGWLLELHAGKSSERRPNPLLRPLCWFGRHTGQKEGGTLYYRCTRCGDDWLLQPNDLRWVNERADRMIARGEIEEAQRWAREQVRRYA